MDLETIVDDWLATWREPVSLEEVSTGPSVDALVDLVHDSNQQSHHDFDEDSLGTPTDSEAKQEF